MSNTTAADIMCPLVATCIPETTLKQAALTMATEDCGSLPVVDGKGSWPIGIITDRDIVCRGVAKGLEPSKTAVSACMTTPAVCVEEETPIDTCADLLGEKQIRRLIVIDGDGNCCGIVSQADLARSVPVEVSGSVLRKVSVPPLSPV